MNYKLAFKAKALKAFKKLNPVIKEQFKAKLIERLTSPHVSASRLTSKLSGRYKIKLKNVGYRLVYDVNDETITVLVLAIGKRERNEVYNLAEREI